MQERESLATFIPTWQVQVPPSREGRHWNSQAREEHLESAGGREVRGGRCGTINIREDT